MTNALLKTSTVYGTQVGHRTVFTREGAINRYKAFLSVCYNPLTPVSAAVLADMEDDMIKIGLSRDELEQMENEYLEGDAE